MTVQEYHDLLAKQKPGRKPKPAGLLLRRSIPMTEIEKLQREAASGRPRLLMEIEREGLPMPTLEHRFHPTRKWQFDLAWPDQRIALEIEGGIWTGGRHTRGSGFAGDMEKYNQAGLLGWRVFRVTPEGIRKGGGIALVEKIFQEIL